SKAFAPVNSVATDLYRRAHNTYLEIFSEIGLPAGLLFVGMIALALRNFWRARAAWAAIGEHDKADMMTHLTISMLAIALFLMFLSSPSLKYLWLMLALSSVVWREAAQARALQGAA
ncbi:MAG: polymerase, partial [Gammaproteobacteria bacterium]